LGACRLATLMSTNGTRDSKIAVVGDGFGSLIVYSTAIYLGFKPEDITIYGPSDNPVGTYQQFAYNLGQTVLRSESESHFLPATGPPSASSTPTPTAARRPSYARSAASTTPASPTSSPRPGSWPSA